MRSQFRSVAMLAVILVSATCGVAAAVQESIVPRYRFEPGKKLTYHEDYSIKYWTAESNSVWDMRDEIIVRVVRVNIDGSYHLVFWMRESSVKTARGKRNEYESSSIFGVDVFPDGREKPMDSMIYGLTPAMLFPPLPQDMVEMRNGCKGVSQEYGFVCKPLTGEAKDVFDAEFSASFMKTLQDTRKVKYAFDRDRGFVRKCEDTFTRDSALKGAGGGTTSLVSVETMPTEEFTRFTEESDRYFASADMYNARMKSAESAAIGESGQITEKAAGDLKKVVAALSEHELKADGEKRLGEHDGWVKQINATVTDRVARTGKPAPDFETTDIDGNKIRLVDLRGKVVVLDFWYRGCVWCARVTPQLNQVTKNFAGKPVAILGMSVDHDPADSRFVINQLGIKYPILRAEGLSDRFGVQGYPTLIVIDAKGIVRKIETGYSPTLPEDLGNEILKLLE